MESNPLLRWRRATRARRDRTASAATEYAVCLGLIVTAVVAAGIFLGPPLQNAFSKSAAGLSPLAGAPSDRQIAGESGARQARPAAEAGPAVRDASFWLRISVVLLVPISAAWWLGRRRAASAAPAEQADPAPIPRELQAKFVAKRQTILAFLSADTQKLVNGHMAVQHVLSKALLTRPPDADVGELRKLMKENTIRHLLVCSPKGEMLGIISDRDIHSRDGAHASDIMTANPISVSPTTPVATVITIMLTQRISCVPVVDQGRLCGIVTTSDLLMALQCVLRLIEQLALPLDLHPGDSSGVTVETSEPDYVGAA
jgi:CBS domain-containing protein/Flp pilus assembly pilin Flp